MHLSSSHISSNKTDHLSKFSNWLLSIGDGTTEYVSLQTDDEEANFIRIPDNLIIKNFENPIDSIINETYPDFKNKYYNHFYIKTRTIVTPTNDVVDIINKEMLDLVCEEEKNLL